MTTGVRKANGEWASTEARVAPGQAETCQIPHPPRDVYCKICQPIGGWYPLCRKHWRDPTPEQLRHTLLTARVLSDG